MTEPKGLCLLFPRGTNRLTFRSLLDGGIMAEMSLGHKLISGTSNDDMIATIGRDPNSVIIINDRHEHERQQLIELPHHPVAVAISSTQNMLAVMLWNGLMCSDSPA